MVASPRSYLYVPGHRPERFAKALASGADAVVLDLEDAVPVADKLEARTSIVDFIVGLEPGAVQVWVRINTGPAGLEDLTAVAATPRGPGIFVPKASAERVAQVGAVAPGLQLCALVESAGAFLELEAIARTPGVVVLALGEVDLVADLGVTPSPSGQELWPLRMQAVVASAACGLEPPIGPVDIDVRDLGGLRSSTLALRRGGFGSRQAIHPDQVPVIHEVLTPTSDELAAAARLLELADSAGGGVGVDDEGRMVDEAVLRSARRVLGRRR